MIVILIFDNICSHNTHRGAAMTKNTVEPIDLILGVKEVERRLAKIGVEFTIHPSCKPGEQFHFTHLYNNMKIVTLLPVAHDHHGYLHTTGKEILVFVRRTIATTPKNSDGVLLSFRPIRVTHDWVTRLTEFLFALHRLCSYTVYCKKDRARMLPGVYKGRVMYTHPHTNGKVARKNVPSHIAVGEINNRIPK